MRPVDARRTSEWKAILSRNGKPSPNPYPYPNLSQGNPSAIPNPDLSRKGKPSPNPYPYPCAGERAR